MKLDPGSAKFRFIVGAIFLLGGLIFNLIETWFFGWNLKPSCPSEALCDYIAEIMIVSGFLIVVYVDLFQKGDKSIE